MTTRLMWLRECWSDIFDTALEALIPVFITALVYFLIRRGCQKKRLGSEFKPRRKAAFWNELIRLLLVCEIAAVICIAVFPDGFWRYFGEIPFFSANSPRDWQYVPYIAAWIQRGRIDAGNFYDLVYNIVFFIPLGLFLPFVMKKPALWKTVLIGFIFTVLVETSQMLTNHCSDINDVIDNTLGAFVGHLLYLPIKGLFPGFTEKCRERV
ncbi:MAG: VanZ family protein [Firmicutes bacterium]|nr:VanZ family protein [Bacillota bacterium]